MKSISLAELEKMRSPTEMWDGPCEKCPSYHHPPDPMSEDIARFHARGEMTTGEVVFRCAWRREKACHGLCKNLGLTNEDLRKASADCYVCPRCERVSYSRHDIEEKYCGRCRAFE